MTNPTISLRHLQHLHGSQIGLYFKYDPVLIGIVRHIQGMRWSNTNKCWYIQTKPENLKRIFAAFKENVNIDRRIFLDSTAKPTIEASRSERVKNCDIKIPEEYACAQQKCCKNRKSDRQNFR